MPKHTSPAPSFQDALEHVQGLVEAPMYVHIALYPHPDGRAVFVAAELIYAHPNATLSIVRREGESVPRKSNEMVQGAAFRAAFRLGQWISDKKQADIVKLHLWNMGAQ